MRIGWIGWTDVLSQLYPLTEDLRRSGHVVEERYLRQDAEGGLNLLDLVTSADAGQWDLLILDSWEVDPVRLRAAISLFKVHEVRQVILVAVRGVIPCGEDNRFSIATRMSEFRLMIMEAQQLSMAVEG